MAEKSATPESDSDVDTSALLRELIEANNRTTHAVRAIVLPSTTMLIAVIIAVVPIVIGIGTSTAPPWIIAGFVLMVGAIAAITQQISETKLSGGQGSVTAAQAAPQSVSEHTPTVQQEASTESGPTASAGSSGKCRFCNKPFPPGYYDSCPDCGRN